MTSRNRLFVGVTLPICAAILMAGAWFASAGDLNPPAGPVAPTQRTPISPNTTPGDADSLFKITLPGSYYLTGNVTGVVGRHGIEIVASGVTLDLNGFDLLGVAGSLGGVSHSVPGLRNIAVANGSVRNWGGEGIDLATLNANNCRVADLLASGNAGSGIRAGFASTVTNCSAYQNSANGITTFDGCTVSNCSAFQNTGGGISTGSGCTVSNCSAYGNTVSGISTSNGSTVSNCSAYTNTGNGISLSDGCTVAECTARINTLDGIRCSAECMVRGNTCSFNGNGGDGAGIHTTSGGNRIEGNNCTNADRGIDVDSARNVIIKNTCAGNTIDWAIAANNVFGPIIDRRAPASPAVSGFSAASSLGSTDPNANFSY